MEAAMALEKKSVAELENIDQVWLYKGRYLQAHFDAAGVA
jgi:hypothetical protein